MNAIAINQQITQQAERLVKRAKRAIDRKKPLFLLVQYNHEGDKVRFIDQVNTLANQQGLITRRYDPLNKPEHGTGYLYKLLQKEVPLCAVPLVVSVPRNSNDEMLLPEFLSYINLHRDAISEFQLRFVLFVRESEMVELINRAPDLWSFRHGTFRLQRPTGSSDVSLWQTLANFELPPVYNQHESVESYLAHSRKLIDATKAPTDKAKLLLDLSRWLNRRYLVQAAIETAFAALDLPGLENTPLCGWLELEVGKSLYYCNDYPSALSHCKRALQLGQQLGKDEQKMAALDFISEIHKVQGDHIAALECMEQVEQLQEKIGANAAQAVTGNRIGEIHLLSGRLDDALHCFKRHLKLAQKVGAKMIEAAIFNNIALVYRHKKDLKQAIKYMLQSVDINQETGNQYAQISALNNLADFYRQLDENDKAMECVQKAIELAKSHDDKAGLCGALFNQGSILYQMRETDMAMAKWVETFRLARANNEAQALTALKKLAVDLGLTDGLQSWEALSQQY